MTKGVVVGLLLLAAAVATYLSVEAALDPLARYRWGLWWESRPRFGESDESYEARQAEYRRRLDAAGDRTSGVTAWVLGVSWMLVGLELIVAGAVFGLFSL